MYAYGETAVNEAFSISKDIKDVNSLKSGVKKYVFLCDLRSEDILFCLC